MTDAADTTPPVSPAPVKPGWKTTEFWFSLAAKVVGALLTSGLWGDGSPLMRALGLAAIVLSSIGYTVSRTLVKTAGTLLLFVALGALLVTTPACGPAAKCKDPANANTAACEAVNAAIDCTKGELPAVVTQFGPVVDQLIGEATGADGSVDWAHVEKMLGSLGSAYGTCVLGNIIENVLASPRKLAPGEVAPSADELRRGLAAFKASHKVDPGLKIHTSRGDL